MIIRVLPVSMFDLPAMEVWLESQARQGRRFLRFWGNLGAVFEKAEPREERYCLEPVIPLMKEEWEIYRDTGWACITADDLEEIRVFRAIRPDPFPLHTDPEIQGLAYQRLGRMLRVRLACLLLFYGLMAVLAIRAWRWPRSAPLLFLAAYWLLWYSWDALALRRLARGTEAGTPPTDRARHGFRRWCWWGFVCLAGVYLLWLLTTAYF